MIKKNTTPEKKDEDLMYFINGARKGQILEQAINDIKKSGIPFSLLKKYQIKIFNDDRKVLIDRLGFASFNNHKLTETYKLIEFPFFNEKSETGHHYVYKPIPTIEGRKYLQPKDKPAIPYILPEVWAIKNKPNKPIWFTEGIKKDLSLLQYGRKPISLAGVWNFKAGKGSELDDEKDLFQDIKDFDWQGRIVYLAFDSDLWVNQNVRYALYELAFKLFAKGAIVKIATWKDAKGIDDYLVKQSDPNKALQDIEDSAKGLLDFIVPDHQKETIRAVAKVELDEVLYNQIISALSKKLGVSSSKLNKTILKYKIGRNKNEKIDLSKVNNLMHFILLGDRKDEFFDWIKSHSNVPEFVKGYAINTSANVPKRKQDITETGKIKYVFEPLTEAKIFAAGLNLVFSCEQVLLYRAGWYQSFHERHFLKLIEHQIHRPYKARRHIAKEVFEVLKDFLHDENLQINTDPNLINVKNGLLDFNTFQCKPHTPELISTYQINANYDPNAKYERFERFLKEVLVKEDYSTPDGELIRLIQQFFGYTLYIVIPFHKSLMLYGLGRNGKSILEYILNELLKRLCSNVHFESIGVDRFATSDLAGKLSNISSELNVGAKLQDGEVKRIIAGDELRAQRKNQPAFDFRPFAKHIICTNNLPRSKDKSLGFFSRFMIVPFHKIFLSQEDYEIIEDEETREQYSIEDESLKGKLKKELDGIFLWAVFGLKDLLTNSGFCVPEQVQKLNKIFKIISTSVETFFEEMVDDSDCMKNTVLPTLYMAYIKYCKEYKIPPETNKKFAESVRNLGYAIEPGTNNSRIVRGICLR